MSADGDGFRLFRQSTPPDALHPAAFCMSATLLPFRHTYPVKEVKPLNVQQVTPFFEALYDQTYDATLLYLTRRCADPTQLPDLLQEVYSEVYAVLLQKGSGYLQNPPAFVRHVARAKLRRFYTLRQRLRQWVPLQRQDAEGELYDDPALEQAAWQMPQPGDQVEEKWLLESIAATLKTYPPDVQKIFICHYQLDLTLRQTAEALGMKESTVKAKLYRTLQKLRTIYATEGADHEGA